MKTIKYRQPIFDREGNFQEFHYWGINIPDSLGNPHNVGYLNMNVGITYPSKSQQFIGLYDIHGVEIYEGDIVYAYDTYGTPYKDGHTGIIEYKDNAFCLNCDGVLLSGWINAEETQVVGNEYQNKNLTAND